MSLKETIDKNLELLVDSGNGINHAAMLANPTSRVVGEDFIIFEAKLQFQYDSQSGSIERIFAGGRVSGDFALGTFTYSSSYNSSFVSCPEFAQSTSDVARGVIKESFGRYNALPESAKIHKPEPVKKKSGILSYFGFRKRN